MIDPTKSPTTYFAETEGTKVPIRLRWAEVNVIYLLRQIKFGSLNIRIEKNLIVAPVTDFSPGGDEPILINWREMNLIHLVRTIEFGKVVVNIANNNIMKIESNFSYRPTTKLAMELLQAEEIKFNILQHG